MNYVMHFCHMGLITATPVHSSERNEKSIPPSVNHQSKYWTHFSKAIYLRFDTKLCKADKSGVNLLYLSNVGVQDMS